MNTHLYYKRATSFVANGYAATTPFFSNLNKSQFTLRVTNCRYRRYYEHSKYFLYESIFTAKEFCAPLIDNFITGKDFHQGKLIAIFPQERIL